MSKLGRGLFFLGLLVLIFGFISMRAFSGDRMPFVWGVLGLGLVLILGAVFKDAEYFASLMQQRSTRHGMNLGVLIILIIVVLGFVNFIGYRRVKKFDLTKDKIHSLSDQSKNVVKNLSDDITLKGFFTEQDAGERDKFRTLVDLYRAESPKVKFELVDPIKRPDEAKAYDVTTRGTIVLQYKEKKNKFDEKSEQGITNAIIKITREKNKTVYFTKGHGEADANGNQPEGADSFRAALKDSSFEVKVTSLIETQKVPEDAEIIIIAGAKTAFLDAEIQILKDYLYKGGKLFIGLDPDNKAGLAPLLEMAGLEHKNNFIIEPFGQLVGGSAATALGVGYSNSSDITKSFQEQPTIFHIASSVKASKTKPDSVTVEEIVKSSPNSFAKSTLVSGAVKFVEGKDEKGPLPIVVTAMGKVKEITGKGAPGEFQVLLAGDSDFIRNMLFEKSLNKDLALNSVAYLAKEKDLVSIRPKQQEGSQISMSKEVATFVFYGLLFLPPGVAFIMGGTFWYRRRAA